MDIHTELLQWNELPNFLNTHSLISILRRASHWGGYGAQCCFSISKNQDTVCMSFSECGWHFKYSVYLRSAPLEDCVTYAPVVVVSKVDTVTVVVVAVDCKWWPRRPGQPATCE